MLFRSVSVKTKTLKVKNDPSSLASRNQIKEYMYPVGFSTSSQNCPNIPLRRFCLFKITTYLEHLFSKQNPPGLVDCQI